MQQAKVVAILAATPALSSILTAVLAATPSLRVRQFESKIALSTYMRLSAVHLLVADFDCEEAPAGSLAQALRADVRADQPKLQIIALASRVTEELKQVAIDSGVDEVIVKPMSPRYLLERVMSRLRAADGASGVLAAPQRQARSESSAAIMAAYAARGDNVVPLFKDR